MPLAQQKVKNEDVSVLLHTTLRLCTSVDDGVESADSDCGLFALARGWLHIRACVHALMSTPCKMMAISERYWAVNKTRQARAASSVTSICIPLPNSSCTPSVNMKRASGNGPTKRGCGVSVSEQQHLSGVTLMISGHSQSNSCADLYDETHVFR